MVSSAGNSMEGLEKLCKAHANDPACDLHRRAFLSYFIKNTTPEMHVFHSDDCRLELLELFALAAVNPDVQRTRQHLAQNISSCTICISKFHASVDEFPERYGKWYSPEVLSNFMQKVSNWNVQRILGALSTHIVIFEHLTTAMIPRSQPEWKASVSAAFFPVFELLCFTEPLQTPSVDQAFTKLCKLSGLRGKFKLNNIIQPGFILLSLHDDVDLRTSALAAIKKSGLQVHSDSEGAIHLLQKFMSCGVSSAPVLYNILRGEQLWVGLCQLLPHLDAMVTEHLFARNRTYFLYFMSQKHCFLSVDGVRASLQFLPRIMDQAIMSETPLPDAGSRTECAIFVEHLNLIFSSLKHWNSGITDGEYRDLLTSSLMDILSCIEKVTEKVKSARSTAPDEILTTLFINITRCITSPNVDLRQKCIKLIQSFMNFGVGSFAKRLLQVIEKFGATLSTSEVLLLRAAYAPFSLSSSLIIKNKVDDSDVVILDTGKVPRPPLPSLNFPASIVPSPALPQKRTYPQEEAVNVIDDVVVVKDDEEVIYVSSISGSNVIHDTAKRTQPLSLSSAQELSSKFTNSLFQTVNPKPKVNPKPLIHQNKSELDSLLEKQQQKRWAELARSLKPDQKQNLATVFMGPNARFVKPAQTVSKLDQLKADLVQPNLVEDVKIDLSKRKMRDPVIKPEEEVYVKRSVKPVEIENARRHNPKTARLGTMIAVPTNASGPVRNMKSFFRAILGRDLLKQGDSADKCKRLPKHFSSINQYMDAFEPLFFTEVWAGILQGFESASANSIANDGRRDSFFPQDASLETVAMEDDFHVISLGVESQFQFSENDIITLKFKRPQLSGLSLKKAMSAATVADQVILLGKVESLSSKHDQNRITVLLKIPSSLISSVTLSIQSAWTIESIFSLGTSMREYQAMLNLTSVSIHRDILEGRIRRPFFATTREVDEFVVRYGVNDSQATAILSAIKLESGFLLIQGPPGSGKTKTILGLVSTIIRERRQRDRVNSKQIMRAPPKFKSASKDGNVTLIYEDEEGGGGAGGGNTVDEKILICAPSNAAVDEILRRLKDGIADGEGGTFVPKMVRLGMPNAIHADVKQFMLEHLIDEGMSLQSKDLLDIDDSMESLRRKLDLLHKKRDNALLCRNNQDGSVVDVNSIDTQIRDIHKKMVTQKQLRASIINGRERERRMIKTRLFSEVDIVLTTLAGAAGHEMLSNKSFAFPTVIVDEACQSAELTTLVPLRHGAKRVIMIGDPQQLPPTIISRSATNFGYDVSLFQRLMYHSPEFVHMLGVQYRMHPAISQFPRTRFYRSMLKDAKDMALRSTAPWHSNPMTPPYLVFDVKGREEVDRHHSLFNMTEANACFNLVQQLALAHPAVSLSGRIGIITFYKQQARKIKSLFIRHYGPNILDSIDINSVDGFQGQEKDIIVLSCVRSGGGRGGVGFLNDERRVNVALTRARCSLLVVGNVDVVGEGSGIWKELFTDAKGRGLIRSGSSIHAVQGKAGNLSAVATP